MSIATKYCDYPLLVKCYHHWDQGFWRLAHRNVLPLNKLSYSDYICNRVELLNIIYIRITDNSVLTRILSLLWNICHVLQEYKTFTKSRCCKVGWGHLSDMWNVQNSVTYWQLRPYVCSDILIQRNGLFSTGMYYKKFI